MVFSIRMKYIRDLKENDNVTSFSTVRQKRIKLKRNGEPYIELILADRTGQIEAKIWDDVNIWRDQIAEGDVVKYRGRVQVYNTSRQLILERLRKTNAEDRAEGFTEQEVIPATAYDISEMWTRLNGLVHENCQSEQILRLLQNVLHRFDEQIKSYPAATEVHHNYWGGFLEHSLSVLESAIFFAGKYPGLDRDLLVAGAVLHDIGKLEELANPHNPGYTTRGILIGHIVLGRDILREEAAKIPDFPGDRLVLLEHLILSHQGQLEWGSPKQPRIPEALVLHYIDDLDAKINRVFRLLRDDQNDSEFTAYDRILGREIFKGGAPRCAEPEASKAASGS